MKNRPHRRERYLRDPLPVQLGGIAANMARIASFVESPSSPVIVASLLYESKFFIEWAAPTAPLDTAALLVELQIALAGWQSRWLRDSANLDARNSLVQFASDWADRVLQVSGLLADTSTGAEA